MNSPPALLVLSYAVAITLSHKESSHHVHWEWLAVASKAAPFPSASKTSTIGFMEGGGSFSRSCWWGFTLQRFQTRQNAHSKHVTPVAGI